MGRPRNKLGGCHVCIVDSQRCCGSSSSSSIVRAVLAIHMLALSAALKQAVDKDGSSRSIDGNHSPPVGGPARATATATTLLSPHLKYMSYYGFNPQQMQGWVNLGLEANGDGNCEVGVDDCNMTGVKDAWHRWRVPSLYGNIPQGGMPNPVFIRGVGLAPNWEANLEAVVKKNILPNLGPGKPLRGVFLGDEICCANATCWTAALKPATEKLRSMLGSSAIIYTNECANRAITEVPREFDLISVDIYAGYTPGSKGIDEVVAAKKMYDIIFPKLHAHQQVMLVPGTFACSNLTYFPLEQQAQNNVEKLSGYFEWAKADKRIAGMNPWHFNTRAAAQHPPPCDMLLGASSMPAVVAKLKEIGKYILAQHTDVFV